LAFTKKHKTKLLSDYEKWLNESQAVFMMEFGNMSMKDINNFRAKVREGGGKVHIVKNTLLEMALVNAGYSETPITGTTILGITAEDVPGLAKAFAEAAKSSDAFNLKGGFMDKQPIGIEQVKMLAELPPLPIMQSRLLGVLSANLDKLVEELSKLSVLEAAELVKALEEKWGVSAAAPVAVAAVGGASGAAAEPVEEQTEFDVVLKDAGPKKIETIKVIRQLTNLGLVEAKTMAETAGAKILSAVGKEAAADAKSKLEGAGAVVEVA
jgi:large subunit ribosomal protein L7/L12